MLKLKGDIVAAINADWVGSGGTLTLHELIGKYKMKCNDVYAVLSAGATKSNLSRITRTGMKVHAYDPAYGTRKEKKS